MTTSNIKDSLYNSHQGAVIAAMGAFSKLGELFTEPARHLSKVVSRLGLGAVVASMALVALSAAPVQAQAQSYNNSLDAAFQKQRQTDFANQLGRVVGEQRGLSNKDIGLASLAALGAGAFTKGSNAPIAAAVVGVGAAFLIPSSNQQQNGFGGNNGNNGNYQQSGNSQNQAVQDTYASYQRYAEPQYRMAVQAHMEGNAAARQSAIVMFGNAWNNASQLGLPLHTISNDVAKFEQLQRMDPNALQAGLSGARTTYQQPGTSMR